MNKCIYLKRSDLRFKSGEHVIPAGLGGKKKLPLGFVSDETNNRFSSKEQSALQESFIAGLRNQIGPGHRGRKIVVQPDGLVTCNKGYKPHVQVLRRKTDTQETPFNSDEHRYVLGFMYEKHTVPLPQVLFLFDNRMRLIRQIYSPGGFDNKCNNVGYCFERIDELREDNLNVVSSNLHPEKTFMVVGSFHDTWYYFMNLPFVSLGTALQNVREQSTSIDKEVFAPMGAEYDYSYTMKGGILDGAFQFLYLKTAFNVLAYKMGQEYVLHPRFDRLRSLILGEIQEDVLYSCDDENINKWIDDRPEREPHIVIIKTIGEQLIAYVTFYGELIGVFEMARGITEPVSFAYICDWHNEKEWIEEL